MDENKPLNPIVKVFLLMAILSVFGYGLFWSGSQLETANDAKKWPTTEALITDVDFGKRREQGGGLGRRIVYDFVDVYYKYELEGITYEGNRIHFDLAPVTDMAKPEYYMELPNQYQVGSTISVHYDPMYPSESVIFPGMTKGDIIIFGVFLFFTVIIGAQVVATITGLNENINKTLFGKTIGILAGTILIGIFGYLIFG